MHYVTDLHLHSKYARAVSPQMNLQMMARLAQQKGINVLSAADFTHPVWFREITEQLEEAEEGLYRLKSHFSNFKSQIPNEKGVRFMLGTEMSSIYKQGDKLRRVHNLIFVPSLEIAEKFNRAVVARGGNLNSDGRPIIGMSSRDLLELLLGIDERAFLIPAHIWTPHFGVYGSASGFDSLEEAFGDLAKYVFGIETGLSSDPDMNWQVPELMNRAILSFSDAHSAPRMAREATVVYLEALSFLNIRHAFERMSKTELGDTNRVAYTLEFYPEEGKYHFSGHRDHNVVFGPEGIRERGNVCPVCGRRLTEGVLYRVQQLSDEQLFDRVQEEMIHGVKWYTDAKKIQPPYVKLVQMQQIVAEALGSSVASKKTQALYAKLCDELDSELHVLLKAPVADIERVAGGRVAEAITKVREGNIAIEPGYDGLYGKVSIWHEGEGKISEAPQMKLGL